MVLRLIPVAALVVAGSLQAQATTKPPTAGSTKVPTPGSTKIATPGSTKAPAPPKVSTPGSTKGLVPRKIPWASDAVPEQMGWLGFRTDPTDDTIIMQVAAGSPAERAGLRAGDRIIASDRLLDRIVMRVRSDSGSFAPTRTHLSGPVMGRAYDMTVRRGDETFTISMVAIAIPDDQLRLMWPTRAPGARPDTVEVEARAYRDELARTALRPKRASTGAPVLTPRNDASGSTRVDSSIARIIDSSELYAALERVSPIYAELERVSPMIAELERVSPLYTELERVLERGAGAVMLDFRTNAIAGAVFEQLNPALGQYFGGINEGVFVIRVGPETPAANAGLEPGDVVQHVNGKPIATIPALRDAIAAESGSIKLLVVRKGRAMNVVLRKE